MWLLLKEKCLKRIFIFSNWTTVLKNIYGLHIEMYTVLVGKIYTLNFEELSDISNKAGIYNQTSFDTFLYPF